MNDRPDSRARSTSAVATLAVCLVAVFAASALWSRNSATPTDALPATTSAIASANDTPGDCQVYVLHHDVADERYIDWVGPWAQRIRCGRAMTPETGFVETGHHANISFFGDASGIHDGDWRYSSEASE